MKKHGPPPCGMKRLGWRAGSVAVSVIPPI
jgi:hypothetical protein